MNATAPGMSAADVSAAVDAMIEALSPHTGRDWSVPAGGLTWSCRETAAHVAHDLTAYAGQVARASATGEPGDAYMPYDLTVRDEASPADVLGVVRACCQLLTAVLDTAPAGLRAWHWGPTDVGGFAAMGVAETLLHTCDVTRGLGVEWRAPEGLCAGVVARLFPGEAETAYADGFGAPELLLWCTGRGEWPGRERCASWTWKAAVD